MWLGIVLVVLLALLVLAGVTGIGVKDSRDPDYSLFRSPGGDSPRSAQSRAVPDRPRATLAELWADFSYGQRRFVELNSVRRPRRRD